MKLINKVMEICVGTIDDYLKKVDAYVEKYKDASPNPIYVWNCPKCDKELLDISNNSYGYEKACPVHGKINPKMEQMVNSRYVLPDEDYENLPLEEKARMNPDNHPRYRKKSQWNNFRYSIPDEYWDNFIENHFFYVPNTHK